ncbi:hypothetical protein [Methanococcoides sp. LMO-2]|uniref:Uncharacterized protein n=1 Tax=Methanococcoides cohabitans TaxID=3136559 RepID=A0ABU9KRP8_9EURY
MDTPENKEMMLTSRLYQQKKDDASSLQPEPIPCPEPEPEPAPEPVPYPEPSKKPRDKKD